MGITTLTPLEAIETAANYFAFGLHALRQAYLASSEPSGTQAALLALSIARVEHVLGGLSDSTEPGDVSRLGLLDILGRRDLRHPERREPSGIYRITTPDGVASDIVIYYYPLDNLYGTDETPLHGFSGRFGALVAATTDAGIPPGGQLVESGRS